MMNNIIRYHCQELGGTPLLRTEEFGEQADGDIELRDKMNDLTPLGPHGFPLNLRPSLKTILRTNYAQMP